MSMYKKNQVAAKVPRLYKVAGKAAEKKFTSSAKADCFTSTDQEVIILKISQGRIKLGGENWLQQQQKKQAIS